MHILVPATADGYDSTMGCDLALVDVDIQDIEKKVALLDHLRLDEDDLYELVFWGDAEFVSDGTAEEAFKHENTSAVPVRVEVPDEYDTERTECDEVHVTTSGIYWACSPKHTDIRVSTIPVSLEQLKKLAEE